MGRELFLHEVVDIVGDGAGRYLDHVAAFDPDAGAGSGLRLVGTWYVIGSTGRWPQAVNLWECCNGWEGWRELLRAAHVERSANKSLDAWWAEAYKVRSGGFDRLLGAVQGSPPVAALYAGEVTGSVFVHEVSTVRAGAQLDYLAAVRDDVVPAMAACGHRLVGMYEVLMGDTEVVTIWATDLDGHVALGRARDAARGFGGVDELSAEAARAVAALANWARLAPTWRTAWREELMVPHPDVAVAAPGVAPGHR